MGYDSAIPQRKNLGEGNGTMGDQTFGCKPQDHSKGRIMAPISEGMKSHTEDGSKRGSAPPVMGNESKYPKQSAPDHGPHKSGKMP